VRQRHGQGKLDGWDWRNNTFADELETCADDDRGSTASFIGNIGMNSCVPSPATYEDNIGPELCGGTGTDTTIYRFVNGATEDYHLAAGSSALGAVSPTFPGLDRDANVRPLNGSAADAGAYERG
jgi:hypothetical protein